MLVFDDEDHVKTGQDGGHEVDVVLSFCVIPAAEHRVGCSQHGAAGVQGGGDAGLRGDKMLVCSVDTTEEHRKLVFFLIQICVSPWRWR